MLMFCVYYIDQEYTTKSVVKPQNIKLQATWFENEPRVKHFVLYQDDNIITQKSCNLKGFTKWLNGIS